MIKTFFKKDFLTDAASLKRYVLAIQAASSRHNVGAYHGRLHLLSKATRYSPPAATGSRAPRTSPSARPTAPPPTGPIQRAARQAVPGQHPRGF